MKTSWCGKTLTLHQYSKKKSMWNFTSSAISIVRGGASSFLFWLLLVPHPGSSLFRWCYFFRSKPVAFFLSENNSYTFLCMHIIYVVHYIVSLIFSISCWANSHPISRTRTLHFHREANSYCILPTQTTDSKNASLKTSNNAIRYVYSSIILHTGKNESALVHCCEKYLRPRIR